MDQTADISALLTAWNQGDPQALDNLVEAFYPDLRRIARHYIRRRGSGQSLESASIANETYLKLVHSRGIQCESRTHFLALCALMIRRILVDHARRRGYAKRGGGTIQVTLDEASVRDASPPFELLALDQALTSLSRIDARKSRVVEMRYFGGLSVEESAEVLQVAPETVKRDWKFAKAWLYRELAARG